MAKEFPSAIFYVCLLDSKNKTYQAMAQQAFSPLDGRCVFVKIKQSFNFGSVSVQTARDWLTDTLPHPPDLVLVTSGEFFYSYRGFTNFNVLFWRTLPLLAATASNCPVAIAPSTFGPFEDGVSIALFRTLATCFGLNVREMASAKFLGHLEIESSLFRDPAFECPLLQSISRRHVSNNVSVALIPRLEYWGIRQDQSLAKKTHQEHQKTAFRDSVSFNVYRKIIQKFLDYPSSIQIHLLAQTLADRDLCASIAGQWPDEGRVRMDFPETYGGFLDSINACSHVITSRFHSAIFGLSLGKQVYGVHFSQHGDKLLGLFEAYGINDRLISINTIDNLFDLNFKMLSRETDSTMPSPGAVPFSIKENISFGGFDCSERITVCLNAIWRIAQFQADGGDMRLLSSFISDYFLLPPARRKGRAWPFSADLRSVLSALEPISEEVVFLSRRFVHDVR